MFVSIIIPTLNRFDQLNRTLQSIVELQASRDIFEVIVVDNGSTDDTPNIVKKYQAMHPDMSILYFYDPIPGLLTGRHRGALEAKGDILSFIDDDVKLSPQWVNSIIDAYSMWPEISFLTGPCLPLFQAYPPDWLKYFWSELPGHGKVCAWLSLLDFGMEEKLINPEWVFGLNYSILKKDFESLGGFHPDCMPKVYHHLQGDGESGLAIKGILKNKKALYHPGVMVHHEVPESRLTLEYFKKRAYYQGLCNSYAKIRTDAGLYPNWNDIKKAAKPSSKKMSKLVQIRHKIKMVLIPQKKVIPDKAYLEYEHIMKILIEEEKAGFNFHQENFKNDQAVQKWCVQENYFDYKLPV